MANTLAHQHAVALSAAAFYAAAAEAREHAAAAAGAVALVGCALDLAIRGSYRHAVTTWTEHQYDWVARKFVARTHR